MKVVIRADASSTLGSGHVMRCKTLADELTRRSADVHFVCCEYPGNLIPMLAGSGYRVIAITPPEHAEQSRDADRTVAAVQAFAPDWVIVDHYALDAEWETRVGASVGRVCVIDDLANRRHACELLLDQNWVGVDAADRYDALVPAHCTRLLGPDYALLQPAFRRLRATLAPRDGTIRRVLVFFGGVDSTNQTVKVLEALGDARFADLAVDIVIGHANPAAQQIASMATLRADTRVYGQLSTLAELMAGADLMLCAGGATTWERCCLGLPAVVAITAPNQQAATRALAARGVHRSLGDAAALGANDWAEAVEQLRRSPGVARDYARASLEMTDGFGACRVGAAVEALSGRFPSGNRAFATS